MSTCTIHICNMHVTDVNMHVADVNVDMECEGTIACLPKPSLLAESPVPLNSP
jgi:hypothetical protein